MAVPGAGRVWAKLPLEHSPSRVLQRSVVQERWHLVALVRLPEPPGGAGGRCAPGGQLSGQEDHAGVGARDGFAPVHPH